MKKDEIIRMVYLMGFITAVWQDFKKHHNLKSERFQCCEITATFFNALDDFEQLSRKIDLSDEVNDELGK